MNDEQIERWFRYRGRFGRWRALRDAEKFRVGPETCWRCKSVQEKVVWHAGIMFLFWICDECGQKNREDWKDPLNSRSSES